MDRKMPFMDGDLLIAEPMKGVNAADTANSPAALSFGDGGILEPNGEPRSEGIASDGAIRIRRVC